MENGNAKNSDTERSEIAKRNVAASLPLLVLISAVVTAFLLRSSVLLAILVIAATCGAIYNLSKKLNKDATGTMGAFGLLAGICWFFLWMCSGVGSWMYNAGHEASRQAALDQQRKDLVAAAAIGNQVQPSVAQANSLKPKEADVTAGHADEPTIEWLPLYTSYDGRMTDAQKQEMWKEKYKGKHVHWRGWVADVSKGWLGGGTLRVKMHPATKTYNVTVNLDAANLKKAMKYGKDDPVVFDGVLSEYTTLLSTIFVVDSGTIVSD
jgi:hypothetical protein